MKCLVPLIRQPSPLPGRLGAHGPHVGAGARLGHRQAVDLLAAHAGVEVLLALRLGPGEQDVRGSRDAGVVQRVVGLAELLLVEHPRHRVEAGPADLLGHVGGVEPGGQRLLRGSARRARGAARRCARPPPRGGTARARRRRASPPRCCAARRSGRSPSSISLLASCPGQSRRGGAASGADGALHVAGDPLVGAADVERRLVGAVQRPDRLDVARLPVGDVALRPRVGAPQPGPGLQRGGRLGPEELGDLRQRLAGAGVRVGGRERRRSAPAAPARRGRRPAAARSSRARPRSRPARSGRDRARTAGRTPPRTWPPTRAAADAATTAGPR